MLWWWMKVVDCWLVEMGDEKESWRAGGLRILCRRRQKSLNARNHSLARNGKSAQINSKFVVFATWEIGANQRRHTKKSC